MIEMKKYFLLILIILSTGCVANYEVIIEESKFKEKLIIDSHNYTPSIEEIYSTYTPYKYSESYDPNLKYRDPENSYYEKFLVNDSLEIKYSGNINEYFSSGIINSCFENFSVAEFADRYKIRASGFKCFDKYLYLSKVNIKLFINSAIFSTNGEKIQGGYMWSIDKNANEKAYIEISFPLIEIEEDQLSAYKEEMCGSSGIGGGLDEKEYKAIQEIYKEEWEELEKEALSSQQEEIKKKKKSSQQEEISKKEQVKKKNNTILIIVVSTILIGLGVVAYKIQKKMRKNIF